MARFVMGILCFAGWIGIANSAHAACTLPSAPTGSLNYDTGDDRFEYCNGGSMWAGLVPEPYQSGAVTASGTAVQFTGIPAGVRRITVMLSGVSTNGTSLLGLQLGDSGGYETTGYSAVGGAFTNANVTRFTASTSLFPITNGTAAAQVYTHTYILTHGGNNTWFVTGNGYTNGTAVATSSGSKTLSGTLDRVQLTTEGGANTFDAGTVSIAYE